MSAGPVSSHLAYLRACITADHAAVEHHPAAGRPASSGRDAGLLLERGPAPLTAPVALPPSNRARDWVAARHDAAADEVVWLGWPVARGARRVEGRVSEVIAALVITEVGFTTVEAPETGRRTDALAPTGRPPVLSETALDLLGLPADERESLRRAFDQQLTERFAARPDAPPGDWIRTVLSVLADHGVPTASLDPDALSPVDAAVALSNTAIAWAGLATSSPYTEALLRDLDTLRDTEVAASPPLQAVLGRITGAEPTVPPLPAPRATPLVQPATIADEQVIAAALELPLTAACIADADRRADLVANVVAAAVARGETVVVAARSARTLDRLDAHLRELGPEVTPVRAGLPPHRAATARRMRHAVRADAAPRALPPRAEAELEWIQAAGPDASLYERWAGAAGRDARLDRAEDRAADALDRLAEVLAAAGQPTAGLGDALVKVDPDRLAAAGSAAQAARVEARDAGERRLLRGRRKGAERAGDAALDDLVEAFGPGLRAAADARRADGGVDALLTLAEVTLTAARARRRADELTPEHGDDAAGLATELDAAARRRAPAARRFVRASWAERLSPPARLRSSVRLYQAGLTEKADGGSLEALHRLVPDVLPVFPAWLVPTALVGSWLPLTTELVDLVVIDDAAQSDIASALPALARARRALVIGDPADLPPVSHVTGALDDELARHHGVDAGARERLSYRGGSLFGAVIAATGRPPLTVDDADAPRNGVRAAARVLVGRSMAGATMAGNGSPLRWVDHAGGFTRGPNGRSGWNADEALAVVDQLLGLVGADARPIPQPSRAARPGAEPDRDRRPGGLSAQFSGLDDDESCIDFAAFGGELRDAAYRRAEIAAAQRPAVVFPPAEADAAREQPPEATGPAETDGDAGAEVDIDLTSIEAEEARNRAVAQPTGSPRPAIGLDVAPIDLRAGALPSIGVMTMLAAHRDALRGIVRERFGGAVTVDTPEGFRGEARDIIVLSLAIGPETPAHLIELVADEGVLAAALGRARTAVVVVGDRDLAERSDGALRALADAVAEVEQSSPAHAGAPRAAS